MPMSLATISADLLEFLSDSSTYVTANVQDLLNMAARDLARVRPRTLLGEITIEADVSEYAVPSDLVLLKAPRWGLEERRRYKPWEASWPGRLPSARIIESGGVLKMFLDPAPTAHQITVIGSAYEFYYVAAHLISATSALTTVRLADRDLLIMRAAVFALEQLANRGSVKPVQLGDGYGSSPKNGTPAALAELLYKEYERMAA